MRLLKDLLYKAGTSEVRGSTAVEVASVSFNSAEVKEGCLFIAIRGTRVDGHQFIPMAVAAGATAVVCEEFPTEIKEGVTYVQVADSQLALAQIASNFYDNPSRELELVGITGTNGKTTTATLLFELFRHLGYSCGLISTVANRINDEIHTATHTTPDPLRLNQLLRQMADEHCTHCFMEVSSHAVAQRRVAGLEFRGGVFTNITHDHLDYHITFDEYLRAKKGFFDQLGDEAFALYNADDRHGKIMVQNSNAMVKTFGIKSMADYRCRIVENSFSGLLLNLDGHEVAYRLIGKFNAYNLTGIYATAVLLGEDPLQVLTQLSLLGAVEGRFEYILSGNLVTGIVDYAHTPDALQNVLTTIRDLRTGNEQVITVVGCGGDRDRTKRPEMARIACKLSSKVILTSDNPRSENAETIIEEMKAGVQPQHYRKVLAVTDRREAIRVACTLANGGDIILIAGKGHEKYQEIKGVKHPFDDKQVLEESFKIFET